MLNSLYIKGYCAMINMKEKFTDFMKKEKGGSEIIAIVLVIAVVLVLAAVFWEQISNFFGTLVGNVFGQDPTSNIKKDNVTIGG